MAKYRKVDPRIWNDRKFMSMSNDGKLAFFYLLTHPNMTALGAMRASVPGLAAEIGWKLEAFREAFREALVQGMVLHDEKASMVWLPNFLKYNKPESPNVVKAWAGSLDLLPECDLLLDVISKACDCANGASKGFAEALPEAFREALAKPCLKTMPIQEQEQEQEQYKQPLSDSDRTTVTGTSKKTTEDSRAAEDRFNAFWSSYPRKTAKQRALAVWKRKKCWNGEFDAILAGLTAHKESDQWQRDDGRYIPHPATFLEQERWRDEIACPVHGQKIGGLTF